MRYANIEEYRHPIRTHQEIKNQISKNSRYSKFKHRAHEIAHIFKNQLTCQLCHVLLEANIYGKDYRIWDAIDHDHDTGEYRGRLCSKCNTTEGKAREYLRYYKPETLYDPNLWMHEQIDKMLSYPHFRDLGINREHLLQYFSLGKYGYVPMDIRPD